MRILLCHRFFWPDTPPYASLLRSIGVSCVEQGHDVTVFTSQPSYKPELELPRRPAREVIDGIAVNRCGVLQERNRNPVLRAFNNLWFSLRVFFHIVFSKRYDIVMTSTFPPVLLAVLAAIASRIRKSRLIYHCMDLHPEVLVLAGAIKNKWVIKLIERFDSWTCRSAEAVVVLSSDMEKTLQSRESARDLNIQVINNFDLPAFDQKGKHLGHEFADNWRSPTLLFAGNVGRFQGLDLLISTMADFKEANLVIMGEGAAKQGLMKKVKAESIRNVEFLGHQPVAVARQLMEQADLGIVSLSPGLYRVAFPSKFMTYLACGCPILALLEPESELARTVTDNQLGYVADQNEGTQLTKILRHMLRNPHELEAMKLRATKFAEQHYAAEQILPRWQVLLDEVAK